MSSSAGPRVTRRQALGLAAGTALGAAGIGLAGWRGGAPRAASATAAGGWPSPLDQPRALAAHLLRRAGLGPAPDELERAAAMPYSDLVEQLTSQSPQSPPPPANPLSYAAVSQTWYRHMASTGAVFPERMALFWHGVLTSDFRKAALTPFIWQQNQLYRRLGTGRLRDLLLAVTHDPAMMRYLDLDRSTGTAPNENYSRELMELFTLGVGHYSEQDVREGARALSGLRIVLVGADGRLVRLPRRGTGTQARQAYAQQILDLLARGATFQGRLDPRRHDQGDKTYLGRRGNLGPEEVVDAILAQDACAVHLAGRALTAFAVPAPSTDLVTRVAHQFRASGYDVRTLMRAILTSDEFRSAQAYRALVRSPADVMVATMRALGRPDLARLCVRAGAGMDQVLYDPPTVAGWPENAGWISSSAWLARLNLAQSVTARGTLPDPGGAVATLLDGVVGADTGAILTAATTPRDHWYALLASPEFHLK